jgi:hypothetical protein
VAEATAAGTDRRPKERRGLGHGKRGLLASSSEGDVPSTGSDNSVGRGAAAQGEEGGGHPHPLDSAFLLWGAT